MIQGALGKLKKVFKGFHSHDDGGIAIMFGLMIPVIVVSVGIGVDLTAAYTVRDQLGRALDASALAAAGSSGDPAVIEERFYDFFDANFTNDSLGVPSGTTLNITDSVISVAATADVPTSFMRIIGYDKMEVYAYTEVKREVRGIEVALVLDVTGSMSSNNRIGTLKTASTNFMDILFSAAGDPEDIRIAIVPYATAVNVGPYGLGLDPDGFAYGTPFINNHENYTFDQNDSDEWWGCVLAHEYPEDTENGDFSWRWDVYDASTWRYWYGMNYNCNKSYIVPLTSNQAKLQGMIDRLYPSGYTLGNLGMVWAYRVLSPEEPFIEGSNWDDPKWKKAVVMMTDGNNTMTNYTAYGDRDDHDVSAWDLNLRMADTCENMKDDDILVYTVTFDQGINNTTKDIFRACATDETKYFDAPSQEDLIMVFERISRELSNLHIQY